MTNEHKRSRLPETDAEVYADFRAYFPPDRADQHIQTYDRLRAAGFLPGDAALRTMTDALNSARAIVKRALS